jgi:hypothetical protein
MKMFTIDNLMDSVESILETIRYLNEKEGYDLSEKEQRSVLKNYLESLFVDHVYDDLMAGDTLELIIESYLREKES